MIAYSSIRVRTTALAVFLCPSQFFNVARGIVFFIACGLLLAHGVAAQQPITPRFPRPSDPPGPLFSSDPRGIDIKATEKFSEIPFEEWIAAKSVNSIPWNIEVSAPHLSIVQRLVVNFRVSISPKAFRSLGPGYQLAFAVRLKPAGGRYLEDGIHVGMTPMEELPKNAYVEFTGEAFVLPGEYTVGFIVYDTVTGRRSTGTRPLRVRSIARDPVPELAKNLPPVEFFHGGFVSERDSDPELRSRLFLPVPTRRPVRVEILVNCTPSVEFEGRRQAHERNVSIMLGMLKVVSQLELPNGSVRVTALDLLHRSIIFEQDNVRELDWTRLRDALAQASPLRVSVKDLEERHRNAAFFRQVLQSRLQPPPRDRATRSAARSDPAAEPLRVILILCSPLLFPERSDLDPLPAVEGGDCRVYHLQYRITPWNLWDELHRVLREFQPTSFQLETPSDFRRALARILADLRAL